MVLKYRGIEYTKHSPLFAPEPKAYTGIYRGVRWFKIRSSPSDSYTERKALTYRGTSYSTAR
jgi:hypothetical protein